MYKILNKLFGWDYVFVEYGYDWYHRRVKFDAYGDPYVKIWDDIVLLSGESAIYLTTTREELLKKTKNVQ